MGVLDQVTMMKKQGIADNDIIADLSQKGVSPKEINDALKQSQIKSAVSDFEEELEPSLNIDENVPVPSKEKESPEEFTSGQQGAYQQNQQGNYYPPQQYYQETPQFQGGYQNYSPQENNTDNIIEIADQIFSDRIRKFQRQEDINTELIALLQSKLENVSERLKKIENIIDKLQISIVEKVGSYGQNLEGIKKEMSMMQDSFSKMVASPKTELMSTRIPDEKEDIKESLRNIAKKKI
jgi:hypothetical protein